MQENSGWVTQKRKRILDLAGNISDRLFQKPPLETAAQSRAQYSPSFCIILVVPIWYKAQSFPPLYISQALFFVS